MPSPQRPSRRTVTFVRHGHSAINSTGASRDVFDPPLSAHGRAQLAAMRDRFEDPEVEPQLVLVSPLTRALESAAILFDSFVDFDTGDVVPTRCVEAAREIVRAGELPEQRRELSELQREWPAVDFSLLASEQDPIANEHRAEFDARAEQLVALATSADDAACTLHRVVVVSHYHCIVAALRRAMAAAVGGITGLGRGCPADALSAAEDALRANGAGIVAHFDRHQRLELQRL